MTEVVSVRFKNKGKVYFFDPAGNTVEKGDFVIVETAKGLEYAECVQGNHDVDDNTLIPPLRPVIRRATAADTERAEANRKKEAEAFDICREKIIKHGLDMKLVDVEFNFEGNKVLFFFTSDGRVDFRELVKDLASVFKTRIELRQIGVRDEARMLGGLGICGKPFCCAQFLDDFQPVSIKMAKTQGLSLNPTKISGTCGRLMCCLKYEQDAYEELVKNVPKVDSFVETPAGKGSVVDVNLLRSTVRVRLDEQADTTLKTFNADELEVLGGKAKRAEFLAAKAEEAARAKEEAAHLESTRPKRSEHKPDSVRHPARRPKKLMLEDSEYLSASPETQERPQHESAKTEHPRTDEQPRRRRRPQPRNERRDNDGKQPSPPSAPSAQKQEGAAGSQHRSSGSRHHRRGKGKRPSGDPTRPPQDN